MKSRSQSGFTLIEVIAAFALMAIALSLCLAVASRAYRQQAQADQLGLAAQWAQNLADDPSAAPLVSGVQHGTTGDGRFQWARTVAPYSDPALVTVKWTLRWQEEDRPRTFETLTLRRAARTPQGATTP